MAATQKLRCNFSTGTNRYSLSASGASDSSLSVLHLPPQITTETLNQNAFVKLSAA